MTCSSVGIAENNWINDISISPNPSSGIFRIQGEMTSSLNVTIMVRDLQGKLVYQSSESGTIIDQKINLSEVENGIYMITVSSDLGSRTEKFFINK